MQDQAVGQSFSETNEPDSTPVLAEGLREQEDPIVRLDRALQRISFALDKKKQSQERQGLEVQELAANVDALISRVRDALAQTDSPEDK
ncbi:hypothetical protein AD948_15200 [Acetobacter senegalensis]|uniref:Uncharacterized protein n=1 Tax=Acetobacter senegalensis TaxID=446692 RepID=A0A149TVN3_9PROT|nr:hypothetical protein [Acetobacter senegalensis]KXV57275.1 hypothetical protein AD948_15200 [Acetobacter senegalensis]